MNFEKRIRLLVDKHRLVLLLGIFAVGSIANAADTDDELQERLLACAGIENQKGKLECFDSVVGTLRNVEPQVVNPNNPQQQSASTPAASEVTKNMTIDDQSVPTKSAAAPEVIAVHDQPLPKAEAPAVSDSDFGLTKKQRNVEKETEVTAIIVRVWTHQDERFSVELDNGQRWRETQGSRVGKPKEGARVIISAGSFGGYRMKIDGITRKAWVRRSQ
jgi:hypothetical protein